MTESKFRRWPKTLCPWVRCTVPKHGHIVPDYPEITEGMEWVFHDPLSVQLKYDGTNICAALTNGELTGLWARNSGPLPTDTPWAEAVRKACAEAGINGTELVYGVLIGSKINGNRHGLKGFAFVPFWPRQLIHHHAAAGVLKQEWTDLVAAHYNDTDMGLPFVRTVGGWIDGVCLRYGVEGVVFHRFHPQFGIPVEGDLGKLRPEMFKRG